MLEPWLSAAVVWVSEQKWFFALDWDEVDGRKNLCGWIIDGWHHHEFVHIVFKFQSYVFAQINTHNIKCIVQVSNCAHFIWTTKCCSIEIEKLNAEETFCKAKFPNEIALPKIEKNGWTGQEEQRTTEIFSRNQQNEAWKVVSFVPFATLKFNKIMTREGIEWVNFIC